MKEIMTKCAAPGTFDKISEFSVILIYNYVGGISYGL